jgi:D-alanyl-D-alanine carboxypeptidase
MITHHLARVTTLICSTVLVTVGCFSPVQSASYQDLIDKAVASGIPGIQACVLKADSEWFGAAGFSSIEQQKLMTLDQPVRLASITKMLTYATVSELAKQGRLKLSDHAVTLLPPDTLKGIPNADQITVAQLLDHKSGLHNFNGENGEDFFSDLFSDPKRGTHRWTAQELVAYAKKPQNTPTAKPGEATSYSSTGYIVLEMILEQIEKHPLQDIYRSRLFKPFGMTSAGLEGADFTTEQIVNSYARPAHGELTQLSPFRNRKAVREDGLVNVSAGLRFYNAWARGAGAVAMSVKDLAKFMNAVEDGRLIVLNNQASEFSQSKKKPNDYFDWNGGSWGIQATILYEPYRDLTVIVLTNASNVGLGSHDVAKEILTAARAKP